MAVFRVALTPRLCACRKNSTRCPGNCRAKAATASVVPSAGPSSSTAMTSHAACVCAPTEASASATNCPIPKQGMMTLTRPVGSFSLMTTRAPASHLPAGPAIPERPPPALVRMCGPIRLPEPGRRLHRRRVQAGQPPEAGLDGAQIPLRNHLAEAVLSRSLRHEVAVTDNHRSLEKSRLGQDVAAVGKIRVGRKITSEAAMTALSARSSPRC
jgi:hypothetical protein